MQQSLGVTHYWAFYGFPSISSPPRQFQAYRWVSRHFCSHGRLARRISQNLPSGMVQAYQALWVYCPASPSVPKWH